ncbi:hypothetical protein TWF706_002414 [Orbilia oligospora]|nr:hypothetical protein TWF706_002414 [Orbilia oligospora]
MSTIKICRKHLPKVDFSSIVHQLPDSTTMTKSWLFFADGARSNNGRGGARAGVGVAGGEGEDFHASKSFSDLVLDGGITKRTSQIAELRAAMVAVSSIDDFYGEFEGNEEPAPKKPRRSLKHGMDEPIDNTAICIIAMDSEYVIKGVTDWLPKWKENGLKNAKGCEPANLSLFLFARGEYL